MDILKEILNSFVSDAPQVEVNMTPPASEVTQGGRMTLVCNVMRSNPEQHTFDWFKNENPIYWHMFKYEKIIDPDDSGRYTCTATNTVGTGSSRPLQIDVKCKFQSFLYCMSELMLYRYPIESMLKYFLPSRPPKEDAHFK